MSIYKLLMGERDYEPKPTLTNRYLFSYFNWWISNTIYSLGLWEFALRLDAYWGLPLVISIAWTVLITVINVRIGYRADNIEDGTSKLRDLKMGFCVFAFTGQFICVAAFAHRLIRNIGSAIWNADIRRLID